ncbi:MAG: acetate--CoA ligase family protein [Candidatus Moranbacteria bacterium]|nr:acetate--CoA ligase family protein [Candidatus Moranbacteria bacterium]
MKNLSSFFSPKSIAIVGASPKSGKLGNVLIENIKKGGWKGKLYFVNPKYAKSRRDYFASLSDIKKSVDLVLVAIPAPFANEILENGAKAKPAIENFAVISSGFKEAGKEGIMLEKNLANIAQKYNLNILGPNCLGFANPAEKLNATFTDVKLQEGSIAIVSQSGALAVALLDWATGAKIGFSKIISIGNKTDIEESEILNFLSSDKSTKAIALYLEDIKNGPKFMEALAKITPRKPVIILKAGKTAVGQKAVSSHTGSLAQDEEIVEAVFEKTNVVQANNIEEFQDIIYYLNSNSVPAKDGAIILTNAGGPGVMASDFVGKSKSIKLLDFPEKFKNEIEKYLPTSASVNNPIDVIGDAPPERYAKTLEYIAKYFPKNPVLVILTPQNQTDPGKVAQIMVNFRGKIENMSACFMGGEKIARAKEFLAKNRIPNFENPERALAVVEKLVKYQKGKNNFAKFHLSANNQKINPTVENTTAEKRKILSWREAEKLFGTCGVRFVKSVSFGSADELKNPPKARLARGGKKISFPCVLKTDDPNIAHRLEKNAVMLNIQNAKELKNTFGKMKKATGAKRFLLQPMAKPGLEMIIGMKNDPTFGPVILCGWGGSFTEIFKDKVILIPPFDKKEIADKLAQLAIFPILKGFRGKKGYDLAEIAKIVAATAQIALENPQIQEIDINPLLVYNDGKERKILDAKIFLT